MDFLQKFAGFIRKEKLFRQKDNILLTISGGVDSIVMAELFHRAKLNFGIAHSNFQLRGKESDRDEAFIKALAKKYRVRFHSKKFETEIFAKKNKMSIQEAARDLRYNWFLELSVEYKYDLVATAHHLDDSIETFFINLLRGTGISGLTGIHPLTEDGIVRPLLFASKKAIKTFAKENKLKFREDRSNKSDIYLRNKIRQQVIPVFEKLNPSFGKTMSGTLHNIFFADHVFNKAIIKEVIDHTHQLNNMPYFSRKELALLDYPIDYLFEFLNPFNFNAAQVQEIWECTKSGKVFSSGGFRVLCDRDKIIFTLQPKMDDTVHSISKAQKSLDYKNFSLSFNTIPVKKNQKFRPPNDNKVACLDYSLLQFPLKLRKWKSGDFFYPLGMKHRQKVSDYLVDHKFSLTEKENVYVLLSGNDIICIPGHRIDDVYKITDGTKKVFRIDYISQLK